MTTFFKSSLYVLFLLAHALSAQTDKQEEAQAQWWTQATEHYRNFAASIEKLKNGHEDAQNVFKYWNDLKVLGTSKVVDNAADISARKIAHIFNKAAKYKTIKLKKALSEACRNDKISFIEKESFLSELYSTKVQKFEIKHRQSKMKIMAKYYQYQSGKYDQEMKRTSLQK